MVEPVYILEGLYDYWEDDEDGYWEEEQTYSDQDYAIEMFKAYSSVAGKGMKWRLRKVISEVICES